MKFLCAVFFQLCFGVFIEGRVFLETLCVIVLV